MHHRIIICEDHDVVVEGIKLMLASHEHYRVDGHARNQQELVSLLKKEEPAVLFLDLNLNGQDGFTILDQIRPQFPSLKVIIFTMYEEGFMIEKAKRLRANGYLLKNCSQSELVEALSHISSSSEFYLPASLLKQKRENETYRDEFVEKMHLTAREIEIIKLVAVGKSAKEIADQLFLSQHTVDTHRRNVLIKLDMKNIADLVRFAAKNNLID